MRNDHNSLNCAIDCTIGTGKGQIGLVRYSQYAGVIGSPAKVVPGSTTIASWVAAGGGGGGGTGGGGGGGVGPSPPHAITDRATKTLSQVRINGLVFEGSNVTSATEQSNQKELLGRQVSNLQPSG